MVNYERELTNCSLSLISHPSSVRPNEAPAQRSWSFKNLQELSIKFKDLVFFKGFYYLVDGWSWVFQLVISLSPSISKRLRYE